MYEQKQMRLLVQPRGGTDAHELIIYRLRASTDLVTIQDAVIRFVGIGAFSTDFYQDFDQMAPRTR